MINDLSSEITEPIELIVDNIKEDYEQMKKMIFGSTPSFDEIIKEIQNLEKEINSL